MSTSAEELRFEATPEEGSVSALLIRPANATALFVVGHGASSNMRNATLQTISDRLAAVGVATLRYNFPYSEHGRGRSSQPVCLATVRSAMAKAHGLAPDLPLFAGGHSFGGRMTSHAAAETPLAQVQGLIFLSFPLHPAGRPDAKRAAHLDGVQLSMLFLSGTRDDLADLDLLRPVCAHLGDRATLHLLDTADHGFRVLKRSRITEEDVFDELARTVREWVLALQGSR